MLPPATKFRALGDAGFFLDHLNIDGQQLIRPEFQNMFVMMNSSYGINDACVSGKPVYDLRARFAWLHLQAHFARDPQVKLSVAAPPPARQRTGALALHLCTVHVALRQDAFLCDGGCLRLLAGKLGSSGWDRVFYRDPSPPSFFVPTSQSPPPPSKQLKNIFQLPCGAYGKNMDSCTAAEMVAFQSYGADMRSNISSIMTVRVGGKGRGGQAGRRSLRVRSLIPLPSADARQPRVHLSRPASCTARAFTTRARTGEFKEDRAWSTLVFA
jgi:hypothetical protein